MNNQSAAPKGRIKSTINSRMVTYYLPRHSLCWPADFWLACGKLERIVQLLQGFFSLALPPFARGKSMKSHGVLRGGGCMQI